MVSAGGGAIRDDDVGEQIRWPLDQDVADFIPPDNGQVTRSEH
jgi:hypothetical protein